MSWSNVNAFSQLLQIPELSEFSQIFFYYRLHAAPIEGSSPENYVEVLDSMTNLGPILDFSVVDLDRQGQGQVNYSAKSVFSICHDNAFISINSSFHRSLLVLAPVLMDPCVLSEVELDSWSKLVWSSQA